MSTDGCEDFNEPTEDDIAAVVRKYPGIAVFSDLLVAPTKADLEEMAADLAARMQKVSARKAPVASTAPSVPEPDHDAVVNEFLEDNGRFRPPSHRARHSTNAFLNSMFARQQAAAQSEAEAGPTSKPKTAEQALKDHDFGAFLDARHREVLADAN